MNKTDSHITPEWSHKIEVDDIETSPTSFHIEANQEQRKNLAKRLNIIGIDRLSADLTVLQEQQSHSYYVSGKLSGDVVQECVVTLKPVEKHVEGKVEGWFGEKDKIVSFANERRERKIQKGHVEVEILDESDDPEPVIDGKIDLGELVAQYLSLSLDPYPHAEDAEFETADEDPGHKKMRDRPNPFEKLKKLKKEIESE